MAALTDSRKDCAMPDLMVTTHNDQAVFGKSYVKVRTTGVMTGGGKETVDIPRLSSMTHGLKLAAPDP